MDRQNYVHDLHRLTDCAGQVGNHQHFIYINPLIYHLGSCKSPCISASLTIMTPRRQKPVVSLLLLPASQTSPATPPSTPTEAVPPSTTPRLCLPLTYTPTPDPLATVKKYTGRMLDRMVGYTWWLLIIVGAGSTAVGIFNFLCVYASWKWLGKWWGLSNENGAPTIVDAA